jgi:hypothetical protein
MQMKMSGEMASDQFVDNRLQWSTESYAGYERANRLLSMGNCHSLASIAMAEIGRARFARTGLACAQ